MTIRYKCDTCGSTLNIKEELAGTDGKCPKCKTAFTVPQPPAAAASEKQVKASKQVRKKPAAAPLGTSSGADDEFDPMAVLMGEEGGASPRGSGKRQPAPPPLSDDELPSELDLELSFDEDAEDPPVKKAKKRRRVQFDSDDDVDVQPSMSASATAGTMLSGGASGGASAGAKDLLTRTMEESRARASRIEDEEPRYHGPTIKDYLREFGPKAAGIVGGFVVAIYGLYYLASGMYGGGMPLPELGRVYGTVTLDGQPLEGAEVMFSPADRSETIEGKPKHRLRTSIATTDEEGYYDLYYVEGIRGAAVTEHRVMIKKFAPNGRLITPFEYADYSMTKRTVESGSQRFDFPLESDPPPEEPQRRR